MLRFIGDNWCTEAIIASLPERLGGVVVSAVIPLAVPSIETSVAVAELIIVSTFELPVRFDKLTVLLVKLAVLFDELAVLARRPSTSFILPISP